MKTEGMTAQTIFNIVSFMTGGLIFLLGITILVGFMIPTYIPSNMRIVMGVVMVLYGGYRVSMTIMKQRNARRDEE
jgi:hypothetical protein